MVKVFFSVFLLLFSFNDCSANEGSNDVSSYQLYTENLPPYFYTNDGSRKGKDLEIVKYLFSSIPLKKSIDDIHITSWQKAYDMALTTPNTIIFPIVRNEARENKFKWSIPFGTTKISLIAKNGFDFSSLQNINNYRVGSILDDIGNLLLQEMGYKRASDYASADFYSLLKKVYLGELDMIVYVEDVALWRIKNFGYSEKDFEVVSTLQTSEVYFAFHNSTPHAVVDLFSKEIAKYLLKKTIN